VAAARAGSRTGAAVFIPAAMAVRMKRPYRNMPSIVGWAGGPGQRFSAGYPAAATCPTACQPAPASSMPFSEARNSIQPSW